MDETTVERIRSLRESGYVKRVHTIPVAGDAQYNVASHSWNAVSLLYLLHPDPSHELVKALLWHDCAERWMGDIPWPAKHYNPELKEAYEEAEKTTLEHLEVWFELEGEDKSWMDAIDALEFWLWCRDQQHMGNMNVVNAEVQTCEVLLTQAWIPSPVKQFVYAYSPGRGKEIADWK